MDVLVLRQFDETCAHGKYLISLDFSLAFDHLHPELALHAFAASGLPVNFVSMIRAVWCHQQRVLLYGQQADPTPQSVQTSVPQGDAWSLYGLSTRQVQQRFPSVELFTVVDDRTLVSNSIAEVLGAKQAWQMWSDHLGMVEKYDKDIYFHHTPKGRQKFLDHDIPAGKILLTPNFWGLNFKGPKDVLLLLERKNA